MRILVTGGRTFNNRQLVVDTLRSIDGTHTLIHGAAVGLDTIAGEVAKEMGWEVLPMPITKEDEAMSDKPGLVRNIRMVSTRPDLVLVFPGGGGTAHCAMVAKAMKLEVRYVNWRAK